MTELTVQNVTRAGLEAAYDAAASGGDEFDNDGKTMLHVKNGATACVVTIDIAKTVDGQAVTDPTVTVPESEDRFIGPFPPSIYNDADGHVNVSYDDESNVTVAALRLS
jgi:hypothetical protein